MQLPYSDELEVQYLSRLFDKMSECYKIFWFQAIVNKVIEGKHELSYGELVNEMIADAWYMVSEYKLNLGPADTLEAAVLYVNEISGMKSSEKKEKILEFLRTSRDKRLAKLKRTLTYNVPYRLQAPFMESMRGSEWNISESNLACRINQEKKLMYYFQNISGMQSAIEIQPEWAEYIKKNQEIVRGWIQYNMITYLQKRNPNVPGIVNKLYPPQERKLEKVKKYWKTVLSVAELRDIYAELPLDKDKISIDHFVPWSYVAHDEFWNLNPTTKNINSSKSNHLPDWNRYFSRLCSMEYMSYQLMWQYESIYAEFEKCQREHINSDEVRLKLYRQGLEKKEFEHNLETIILPVYQSAKNLGFREWVYPCE